MSAAARDGAVRDRWRAAHANAAYRDGPCHRCGARGSRSRRDPAQSRRHRCGSIGSGSGRAPTGVSLSTHDAERIIRVVAAHVGAEVNSATPILSAELPLTGERFEGVLPPVVRAPAFAIRKRAVAVMTLDRYVERPACSRRATPSSCATPCAPGRTSSSSAAPAPARRRS